MASLKKVSIDTSVLLAMADGCDISKESCRLLQNHWYSPVICSTVIQECELVMKRGEKDPYPRKLGKNLVNKMVTSWGILPAPQKQSVLNGVSQEMARKLQRATDPQSKMKENNFLVLTDSALIDCHIYLTWNTDQLKLRRASSYELTLDMLDLPALQIASPHEINEGFQMLIS